MVSAIPIACNPKAISEARRPRYNELTTQLRNAATQRTDLPNGYQFTLDSRVISFTDTAE